VAVLGGAAGQGQWRDGWRAGVGGRGSVLASDIDVGGLGGLDHGNITVIRHDLERDGLPGGGFDLIHARLVLEHPRAPAAAAAKLASALRAGAG
jgi:hypothetical protein